MNNDSPKMFVDDDVYLGETKQTFNYSVEAKEEGLALKGYKEKDKTVINITPYKELSYKYETGYGAYLCEKADNLPEGVLPDTLIISGNFISPLDIGQSYEAYGEISIYRDKKQLRVIKIKKVMPKNRRGIISFLRSLNDMGVFADLIYEEYGDNSLEMIRNNPLELVTLSPSIYKELVLDWQNQLSEVKDDQEILALLIGYGLRTYQAKQLFDKYKESVISKIKENPYFLAKEVKGYSFTRCDNLAKNIGFSPDSPLRISEAIMFVLGNAINEGHVYLPKEKLIRDVSDLISIKMSVSEMKKAYREHSGKESFVYKYGNLSFEVSVPYLTDCFIDYNNSSSRWEKEEAKLVVLEIEDSLIEAELKPLVLSNRIAISGDKIYDKDMFDYEEAVAYRINLISTNEEVIKDVNVQDILGNYLKKRNIVDRKSVV